MARYYKGEVRSGPLDLVLKGNFKKVKTYHSVLMSTSKSGVARLELYDNYDHSLALQPSLMVVGKDVIKVEKVNYKGKENAFLISTKDHHYTFLTKSPFDCSIWVENIQNILLLGAQEAKNDICENSDGIILQNTEFIVKIHEDTKDKLKCKGTVKLKVENGSIIISSIPGKMLTAWTLTHIRRFGREDKNIFFLEAGRQSRKEGTFRFVTEQAEGILQAIKTVQNKKETMDGPGHSPTSKVFNSAPQSLIAKMQPAQHINDPLYEEFDMLPAANTNKPQGTQELQAAAQVPQSSLISNVHTYRNTESTRPSCEPTYDEPVMITDAWKSNGLDEDSEYSTLTFCTTVPSKKQEEEEGDHYWQGAMSQQCAEPVYATIDRSKKKM